MTVNLDSVVVRSASALAADLEAETVLMNMEGGRYYGLTRTSRDIWGRLAAPVDVRVLCADLAALYDAPTATIEADTLRFLAYLEESGLIEAAG